MSSTGAMIQMLMIASALLTVAGLTCNGDKRVTFFTDTKRKGDAKTFYVPSTGACMTVPRSDCYYPDAGTLPRSDVSSVDWYDVGTDPYTVCLCYNSDCTACKCWQGNDGVPNNLANDYVTMADGSQKALGNHVSAVFTVCEGSRSSPYQRRSAPSNLTLPAECSEPIFFGPESCSKEYINLEWNFEAVNQCRGVCNACRTGSKDQYVYRVCQPDDDTYGCLVLAPIEGAAELCAEHAGLDNVYSRVVRASHTDYCKKMRLYCDAAGKVCNCDVCAGNKFSSLYMTVKICKDSSTTIGYC